MGFDRLHPGIALVIFASVLAGSAFLNHPMFLALSYMGAFAYSVKRNGIRALVFNAALVPIAVAFGFYYASYTHFGVTVLDHNLIGNNLTLESLLKGFSLGFTGAAIVMWLSCVLSVFTADKVVYLLGVLSPRLSLFASIVLRMAPRLKKQAATIGVARLGVGRGASQGNLFQRCLNAMKIASMLVTWLLESLSSIAASMNSRGCSLRGRTAFSLYRFDARDRCLTVAVFACLTAAAMAFVMGQATMSFSPVVALPSLHVIAPLLCLGYGALCFAPLALDLWTERCFRHAREASFGH